MHCLTCWQTRKQSLRPNSLSKTVSDLELQAKINTLHQRIAEVEAEKRGDTLREMEADALADTLADNLEEVNAGENKQITERSKGHITSGVTGLYGSRDKDQNSWQNTERY